MTGKKPEEPKTLAELFCYLPDPADRKRLEEFMIAYEEFGNPPPDIKRRYTCCSDWPPAQQEWLKKNEPRRYWDGFPRFVKAFFKREVTKAHEMGRLSQVEPYLQKLFLLDQMDIGEDGHRVEEPKKGRGK